jgi:hypothetical protein
MSRLLLPLALLAGCATMPVSLVPVAKGQAVQASEYPLRVDGQPGGQVHFSTGKIDGNTVRIGLRVENHSDQAYVLRFSEGTPSQLKVLPGGSTRQELQFTLPPGRRASDLSAVTVRWSLEVGPAAPVARRTTFVAQLGRRLPFASPDPSDTFADIPTGEQLGRINQSRRVIF